MEENIDLMELVKYFWSKKIWIILVGVICIILAGVYTKYLVTPEYTASATLILTNDDFKTEADVCAYTKLPDRYFAIANSRRVLDKVIANLKINDITNVEKFKENNIVITYSPVNFSITVTVTIENAKKAADIANEIINVTIEEIKNIYDDKNVQILDVAQENWKPVNVELTLNVAKFVIMGEIFACGYILIRYIFIEEMKMEKKKDLEEK